jgi:hypothetical protein
MLFYNKFMVGARQIHDTISDILEGVMKNEINVISFENCKTFEYNIASNKPNFLKISKLVTYSDDESQIFL